MGRGTRHSKSCQIKPYFTYDERNSRSNVYRGLGTSRVALDESSGTMTVRVGTDSQKLFDACWLCNQRAVGPVVTEKGLLYCRTCIIEYMGEERKEIKKKMKAWEEQEAAKVDKKDNTDEAKKILREEASKRVEEAILPTEGVAMAAEIGVKEGLLEKRADEENQKTQTMNSFWVAQNAPEWSKTELTKPDTTIRCPFSKKPLKLKKLREVKWTMKRDDENKQDLFICPISSTTFKNGVAICILPDGTAVSKVGLEKCWEKSSATTFICPLTSETLAKSDIIDLAKSGTAFAASTAGQDIGGTEAKKYRHSLTMAIS